MQYFIVLKLLRLYVNEFLYYFTYFLFFSCLSKKTNKTPKTHWVGLFLKAQGFF